jgi:uncharacterized protein with PQ loop repeat
MFAYIANLYFAFGYYGWTRMSIAMIFNGAIGFFYIGVLVTLKRYEKFSAREVLFMKVLPIMIVLTIVLPWILQEHMITAILFGSLFWMANQPYQIWKNKDAGSVDIKYIGVFLTSVMFWTVFAFKTHTVPLMLVNPFVFVIMGTTVLLWLKHKKNLSQIPA